MAFRFPRLVKVGSLAKRRAPTPLHIHVGKEAADFYLELDNSGNVTIADALGNGLPPAHLKLLRTQYDYQIRRWLDEQASRINRDMDNLLGVRYETPDPDAELVCQVPIVEAPTLTITDLKPLGLMGRLFKSRREKIEQENRELILQHNQGFEERDKAWQDNQIKQEKLRHLIETQRLYDINAMSEFLEWRLSDIDLSYEAIISFDIATVSDMFVDIKFPNITELPETQAAVAKRGYKLNIKLISATQLRKYYAEYIYAIVFRVIGECFNALPNLNRVIFSGFVEDKVTGSRKSKIGYLYSVIVERNQWRRIQFSQLEKIDVPLIFESFNQRHSMTKSYVFKSIEPFGFADLAV